MAIFQTFVKLLDGKTATLTFSSPTISGESIKKHLYKITQIPPHYQRLITGCQQIEEETLINASKDGFFSTIHLLLRLHGGKGGFGSLLRGAATKAGQKKTNNFDACRDMSGRRIRHVNAEKKLEEWKLEAEDRKLEKIAEDFIKKKVKAVKKSGSKDSEKYIEKYREDSAKCMEEVEASVRESFLLYENSKRKILPASGSASKRLKIWMEKENVDEGDSYDEDESDEEKSVVLDDQSHLVRNKDGEGSSGSVSGCSSNSNVEEENGIVLGCFESEEVCGNGAIRAQADVVVGPSLTIHSEMVSGSEVNEVSGIEVDYAKEDGSLQLETGVCHETLGKENGSDESRSGVYEELAVKCTKISDLQKPLNFDEFNTAAEMEDLGMERLKAELQARGLKCGGTLQERASRLFLLKTTPVEMLPKKLLAKK